MSEVMNVGVMNVGQSRKTDIAESKCSLLLFGKNQSFSWLAKMSLEHEIYHGNKMPKN